MPSPEQRHSNIEVRHGALENTAAERAAELRKQSLEQAGERAPEKSVERTVAEAREAALEAALPRTETATSEHKQHASQHTPLITPHYARKEGYKQTMQSVRRELSAPERVFSKVIHNPVIEKASDIAGTTLARPNAILAGSITAFVTVLILYSLARHYGWSLQGSETIVAFAFGWILGICLDILRIALHRRRS